MAPNADDVLAYQSVYEAIKARVEQGTTVVTNHEAGNALLTEISAQVQVDTFKVLDQDLINLHTSCFGTFSAVKNTPSDPHAPRDQPLLDLQALQDEFTRTRVKTLEIQKELVNKTGAGLKPPRLGLPHFKGNAADWPDFKAAFVVMVNDSPKFLPTEKLRLLKEALSGRAADNITDLKTTDVNWKIAWDRMPARYDSARETAYAALRPLFELRDLKTPNGAGIHYLLAQVRTARAQLDEIPLGGVGKDEVLFSHFILAHLDDETSIKFNDSLPNSDVPSI